MTLLVDFYLREVVMSRNIRKARITRISKVKIGGSLEKRVIALEKQLGYKITGSRILIKLKHHSH